MDTKHPHDAKFLKLHDTQHTEGIINPINFQMSDINSIEGLKNNIFRIGTNGPIHHSHNSLKLIK